MTDELRRGAWPKRHPIALVVAVLLILAVFWLALRPRGSGEEEEVPAVVSVETATARVGTFPITLAVLGSVDARAGAEAQLAAPAATRVTAIYVSTGDRVRAGQPLLALDESVWSAQTAQADAAFRAAQQAYERANRLAEEGVGARKDAEAAASDLAQARALRAEARRRQSLGVLRSPIPGVVTGMWATLEQPVDVNAPLVEVVDPNGLEVRFHLSPDEAGRVAPGAAVRLTSGPDSTAVLLGMGVVRGVSAAVDSTTGSVDVRVALTAPTRELRVGESVSGQITIAEHADAVIVPSSALVPTGDGVQLFVVDSARVAHARPVTIGARTGSEVEVLSGLRGGETIVASGAFGVTDGATLARPTARP